MDMSKDKGHDSSNDGFLATGTFDELIPAGGRVYFMKYKGDMAARPEAFIDSTGRIKWDVEVLLSTPSLVSLSLYSY